MLVNWRSYLGMIMCHPVYLFSSKLRTYSPELVYVQNILWFIWIGNALWPAIHEVYFTLKSCKHFITGQGSAGYAYTQQTIILPSQLKCHWITLTHCCCSLISFSMSWTLTIMYVCVFNNASLNKSGNVMFGLRICSKMPVTHKRMLQTVVVQLKDEILGMFIWRTFSSKIIHNA